MGVGADDDEVIEARRGISCLVLHCSRRREGENQKLARGWGFLGVGQVFGADRRERRWHWLGGVEQAGAVFIDRRIQHPRGPRISGSEPGVRWCVGHKVALHYSSTAEYKKINKN